LDEIQTIHFFNGELQSVTLLTEVNFKTPIVQEKNSSTLDVPLSDWRQPGGLVPCSLFNRFALIN
jgi:hypothetical protein